MPNRLRAVGREIEKVVGFAAALLCFSVGHLTQQGMTEWNPDDPFDLGIWTQSPPKKTLSLTVKDRRGGHCRFESPKKPLETSAAVLP